MNAPFDGLVSRTARTLVEVVPAVNRSLRLLTAERTHQMITVPQYRVLVLLKDRPGMGVKELADREGVEPPTMSRTVEILVEKGLVERQTDPTDRRYVRVSLVPVGIALVDQVRSDVALALESALADWDPASLEHLLEALDRLGSSSLVNHNPEAPVV
jgi:DNA-binding MarR family transcriptional regulator